MLMQPNRLVHATGVKILQVTRILSSAEMDPAAKFFAIEGKPLPLLFLGHLKVKILKTC